MGSDDGGQRATEALELEPRGRERMIRRSTRILMEIVIGLLAGVIILSGIAIWRLSSGPVTLNFLTPHLEAAFNQVNDDITVEVEETVLAWGGWPQSLDLRARKIKLRDREGFIVATLPTVRVKLSLRALLKGTVAPTLIEIFGPTLSLVRGTDGGLQFGEPEEGQGAGSQRAALLPLLEELTSTPDPERPLAYLSTVRILGAKVSVNDQKLLVTWQAPRTNFEVRRDPAGLAGEMEVTLALAGEEARWTADFLYRRSDGHLVLDGRFADLQPAALAPLLSGLEPLAGVRVPFAGHLDAEVDGEGDLKQLTFEINGGAGEVELPEILATPRPVDSISLAGRFDGGGRRLDITQAEIRFAKAAKAAKTDSPGSVIAATASLADYGDDIAVTLSGGLDQVPIDELALYWPEHAVRNGREWVLENVSNGLARDLRFDLAAKVPWDDPGAAEIRSIAASFAYQGLTAHFLRPMPPVTDISGTAVFDGSTIEFRPTGGRLGALTVVEPHVEILGLEGEDSHMAMTLNVNGPLREALKLLDHDRLKLIEPLGIDPRDVAGDSRSELAFRFPLLKDLKFDQMEVTAKAALEQVSAKQILLGQDASEGQLTLDLTKAGMTVSGPLRLGGVALTLVWQEDFTGLVDPRRSFKAQAGRIEAEERAAFRVDLRPFLEGPVSANLVAEFRRDDTITIEGVANLQSAVLDFPFLKWRKAVGEAGDARFRVLLVDDQPRAVEFFDVRAGTMKAKGRADLADNAVGFSAIDLELLSYDRTELSGVKVVRREPGFDIQVAGGILDATVYLGGEQEEDEEASREVEQEPLTPLQIVAPKLDALYFAEDRFLESADLRMARSSIGWEEVYLRALVPQALRRVSAFTASSIDDSALSFAFRPDGKGRYDVMVETDDMGSVLQALNVIDTVVGGKLRIVGKSDLTALDSPMRGQLEAEGYRMVDAPALASLLTVASLTGVVDLLTGDGIRFERLTGDVTFADNVLSTNLMRAFGPALGLTAKGEVSFRRGSVDLEGTVVPAYTINRVLGAIPILGWILVGGEGEGVLAVTYTMTGDLADPKVAVNPLSALAPGFLRGLIGFSRTDSDEELDTRPSLYPSDQGR